jgi:REP-associated tyrosine transposase
VIEHASLPSNHRRNRVPGGTFFFTVNLLDRRSDLLVARIDALCGAVRQLRARAPLHIDAWWSFRSHALCVDLAASRFEFSRSLAGNQDCVCKIVARQGAAITGPDQPWRTRYLQRRYWEHTIRDERDFAAHMDYTHFNPVKHGLVAHPANWPHSWFHRCVNIGFYPAEWTGGSDEPQQIGEQL